MIELIRREDNAPVSAEILAGMKPADLVVVGREWANERSLVLQELLKCGVQRSEWPQSLHWDWGRKASELQLLEATGFGIVCQGKWQGVMLTKTASHCALLKEEKGKPLVYIDYLEVAPWNWRIPELNREGTFRGIGTVLLWKAIKQSEEEEFHGRIGLHALPQAEGFYERIGMVRLGPDPEKQDLSYFELSRERAQSLLNRGEPL